jgi:hypothetical protein
LKQQIGNPRDYDQNRQAPDSFLLETDLSIPQPTTEPQHSVPEPILDLKESFTPIKSLNTFLFEWKIKARITKKHLKKSWRNQRSSGSLLNIELID